MIPNLHIREKLLEAHRQELLREREQHRLVARLSLHKGSVGRHTIAQCGTFLIVVGTWLKRFEPQEAKLASSGEVAASPSGRLQ
jgi:hypothetical protein